ncbi:calcium-binding protein, partial [Rhizobium herbae]
MANITVNSGFGFDIRDLDFSGITHAVSYTRSSTRFVAQYAMGKDEFRGANFTYDRMGAPTGGTVTSYGIWFQATRAYLIDEVSLSMKSIMAAARTPGTSDDVNLVAGALKGADNFNGGDGADYVKLYAGNDTASGDGGNDIISGGDGNDTLKGGDGNDKLYGEAGADKLDGGAGTDTASYAAAAVGVTASLSNAAVNTGEAKGDVYVSIEWLAGSTFGDKLYGNGSANLLAGGSGNDLLNGGAGADKLDGGTGTDTASYSGASAGVTASLANASINTGDAKGDTYVSIEWLAGSTFGDKLYGNGSANLLAGGSGNDLLNGGAGADKLDGGTGTDTAAYYGAS